MLAYADCNLADENEGYRMRNLNFRAEGAVSKSKAIEIARKAMPHGYNEFNANLIDRLPDDAEIIFAREGSVCLYVKGKLRKVDLKEDEFDFNPDTNETRIWWD